MFDESNNEKVTDLLVVIGHYGIHSTNLILGF